MIDSGLEIFVNFMQFLQQLKDAFSTCLAIFFFTEISRWEKFSVNELVFRSVCRQELQDAWESVGTPTSRTMHTLWGHGERWRQRHAARLFTNAFANVHTRYHFIFGRSQTGNIHVLVLRRYSRLAVDLKFTIHIHIHRRLSRVHLAPKFLQNTAMQKCLFTLFFKKSTTQTYPY